MPEKKEFERVKADYFEKNAALLQAVKETTFENCESLVNKVRLASLRLQSVNSYDSLISHIRTP